MLFGFSSIALSRSSIASSYFLLGSVNDATVDVAGGIIGLDLDRLAECLDRFLHFAGALVGEAEVVVVVGLFRIGLDRFFEKIDRLVPFSFLGGLDPVLAELVSLRFRIGLGDRGQQQCQEKRGGEAAIEDFHSVGVAQLYLQAGTLAVTTFSRKQKLTSGPQITLQAPPAERPVRRSA